LERAEKFWTVEGNKHSVSEASAKKAGVLDRDDMGYSVHGNRKTREGDSLLERHAQFRYLHVSVNAAVAEMAEVTITHHDFHGAWNYTITPDPPRIRVAGSGRANRSSADRLGSLPTRVQAK
jgi:hypothetical protein